MRLRRAAAVAVGLTTLGSTTPASAQESPKQDAVERSVVKKLNAMRAQHGLRRLRSSRALNRAADSKSVEIVTTGSFSHGALGPRVRRFVRAKAVGETLAWVPPSQGSDAAAVVGAWMRSPSHRATLLSPRFARVGIGRRSGSLGGGPAVVFTVDLASAR
ncbi:MAG TPA: CAP domain-containing protein [Solirubrobacteraceae bacterium]|nr:CAP domain-containing protein [Solirubrobacteraceae bacterium]